MTLSHRWQVTGADGRVFYVYGRSHAEAITRAAHAVPLTASSRCVRAGYYDGDKNVIVDGEVLAKVIDIRRAPCA